MMAHRPVPTAYIWEFGNNSGGQSNTWLEDVPELERLSADDFIDWYLATVEPEFKEWYLLRQEERDAEKILSSRGKVQGQRVAAELHTARDNR